MTGVPTIPMLPLKFVYCPPHASYMSVFFGTRMPGCVKFFLQYSRPSSPSNAYSVLLTVAT